jgi:hypothetical protein
MFKRRTLFVLGAGASAEVGLPLGSQLADTIGTKVDIRFEEFGTKSVGSGDMELFEQIRAKFPTEAAEYQEAGWLIRDGIGLSSSIDDFLDVHSKNKRLVRYGKAAIVKSVLEAERKSKLFVEHLGQKTLDFSSIENTWFVKLMRLLGRGISRETARQIFDSVSFIVFNYDRCFEQFLFHALQKLYGIEGQEAFAILSDLHIIHPYGLVGAFAGQSSRIGIPFGGHGQRLREDYVALSDQVSTYTEQVTDSGLLSQIHREISQAECIVSLGFAYHDQNMTMLMPPSAMPHKFMFGTAFDMSDADRNVVVDQIARFFTPNMSAQVRAERIKIVNLTCAKLFDDYGKSLTGGD